MPTLSIITVVLNDRDGLERTLDSVASQTWRDLEHLAVDGASSDGTAEVLRARAGQLAGWVSEKDRGVYHAYNKGLLMAKGTYVLFLNAGDHLADVTALARFFAVPFEEEIVYGDLLFSKAGKIRRQNYPDRLTLRHLMRDHVPTPATVFRRETLLRLGGYQEDLRIAADYDMSLRAIVTSRVTTQHVPVALSVQYHGGLSTHRSSRALLAREWRLCQERNLHPLVVELYQEYVTLEERSTLGRRLRMLFRPFARRLRDGLRRLRGKPLDPPRVA